MAIVVGGMTALELVELGSAVAGGTLSLVKLSEEVHKLGTHGDQKLAGDHQCIALKIIDDLRTKLDAAHRAATQPAQVPLTTKAKQP
jgi:hypothetical protein